MLQAARTLRVEREKEHTLAQQKLEQKNQVSSSKNIVHFDTVTAWEFVLLSS